MLEGIILILTLAALVINAVAAFLLYKGLRRKGFILFSIAWACSLTVFIINWAASGHPPFANMYHVLAALPLVLMPMLAYVSHTEPEFDWISWVFPALAVVALVGTLFMDNSLDWSLNPALDSPFFVPHVLAYCISYAMSALAFIMGIVYFIDRKNAERYLDAAHEFTRISVPFMTLGMCLGAIWAEQAWGIYWSWDAKETFSLATWLTYLGFLHLMKQKHSKTLANIIQMIGFIILLGTFFGVNLLNSVHAY